MISWTNEGKMRVWIQGLEAFVEGGLWLQAFLAFSLLANLMEGWLCGFVDGGWVG